MGYIAYYKSKDQNLMNSFIKNKKHLPEINRISDDLKHSTLRVPIDLHKPMRAKGENKMISGRCTLKYRVHRKTPGKVGIRFVKGKSETKNMINKTNPFVSEFSILN